MDNNVLYTEEYENSRVTNTPEAIQYVLDQIKEVHNEENGWVIGTPIITPNSDNCTVTIKVKLTKYNVNQQQFGGRPR